MKTRRGAASLLGLAMLLWTASIAIAQSQPEVRRARPVDEPPIPRALPVEEPPARPPRPPTDESVDRVLRSLKENAPEPPQHEGQGAAERQLDYANGLFTRKLYDLAAPEYQKYLDDYPGRAGRANAYFSLGECYRNLGRASSARTNLQKVLNDYPDSEFAGPAAYALAEMEFADKDYAGALPLFHRSVGKSKEPAVALSAHYFEARCLEALGRKEEAANIYAGIKSGVGGAWRHDRARSCAGRQGKDR
jgi:TolA-binding protein